MNQFILIALLHIALASGFKMSIGGEGMTFENSYSYTFHKTPATFEEAKKICIQQGAKLAIIESYAEEQVNIHYFKFITLGS